eukprot:172561-Pelagomonas_calceolata.AAC.5
MHESIPEDPLLQVQQAITPPHHSASAHSTAGYVQPVAHKHRSVLVSACGHGTRGCMPLPPTIPVPGKAVSISHGRATCVSTPAQQQQPVSAGSSCSIHPVR